MQYLRELESMKNVSNWNHFSYESGSLQISKWKDSFAFAVVNQEIVLLIIRNKGDCEEIILI